MVTTLAILMFIAALLMLIVGAFAFGYHTGYDKGQADAAFRQAKRQSAAYRARHLT